LSSRQAHSQGITKETDENPEDESTILEKDWVTPSPKPQPVDQDSSIDEQMEWDSEDDESLTLWEQCGNPWGDIGQNEDDNVLISPYGGLNLPLEAMTGLAAPRFNSNPFIEGSPYVLTHHLPSMGIRVLKLTRDVIAMRPWGLTVKRHEFGGACLVSAVDPISPAAGAVSGYPYCIIYFKPLCENDYRYSHLPFILIHHFSGGYWRSSLIWQQFSGTTFERYDPLC
jgi:hypothetical protein